jgi:hypothetical protein
VSVPGLIFQTNIAVARFARVACHDACAYDPADVPGPGQQCPGACPDTILPGADDDGKYLDAAGLFLLDWTIGYGLGLGYFWALVWVALFTGIGAAVLWCIGASLDHLLPIVELNKEFSDFFDDPERERLSGLQLSYFAVQALIGYVLASFVVAGLAGLTQAQ